MFSVLKSISSYLEITGTGFKKKRDKLRLLEDIPTKACEIAVACNVLPQSAGRIKTKTELDRPQHITPGKTTPQQDRMPEVCLEESN